MLQVKDLQVEYKVNPLGMDEPKPRFSYRLEGTSESQSARRIRVCCECGTTVWDSGFVSGSETSQIVYEGLPLKPFTRYDWQVCVKDENGKTSQWSEKAFFETGFLNTVWNGKWVTVRGNAMGNLQNVSCIRRLFTPKKKVAKARLYATALGLYRPFLNGKDVTEDVFLPGWTSYRNRVQYQAYDITDQLAKGDNMLSFLLGDGWYSGSIVRLWAGGSDTYGYAPLLKAEIHLTYSDGTQEILASDETFEFIDNGADGGNEIRFSDFYMGEYFVTNTLGWNWMLPDCKMPKFSPQFKIRVGHVRPHQPKFKDVETVWQSGAPIRHIMDIKPVSITHRKNGNWIVDFGQNLAGREKITLKNVLAGTCIMIRHGEMLQENGALYTDNLRTATATTVYRSQCDKDYEEYEPTFTNYGFRYLEISGWPGTLKKENITARVIHSDLPMTGSFSCSEPLLNRLYSNIVWGQRGNFLDVPTDCPQRDERLGWTGDTQVFMNMATYSMYAPEFYTKWIEDLNLDQTPGGAYPYVAPLPYEIGNEYHGSTGWADAGVVCPWLMFDKYADTRILEKYYDNIVRWLDLQVKNAKGSYIVENTDYGDWLNLDDPTPKPLLSSAYFIGMTRLASKMAAAIGRKEESEYRMRICQEASDAFTKEFLTAKGTLKVTSQTAALLTLNFGCIPEKYEKNVAEQLVKNIRSRKIHLSTGFLGTPLLLNVLSRFGYLDLAYDLLLQTSYPGWLYPITQGATTMWERWNSYTKDNGFGDSGMNSFNHYAYGAVGEWFYETICGIKSISCCAKTAGFRRFRLAPQPGKRLTHASAVFQSMSGEIRSSWKRTAKTFTWEFTVPCNTVAEIIPPFANMPKTEGIEQDETGKWIARPGSYKLVFRTMGK